MDEYLPHRVVAHTPPSTVQPPARTPSLHERLNPLILELIGLFAGEDDPHLSTHLI